MLIRFLCSNFLSFGEDFDFRMGVNGYRKHKDFPDHVYSKSPKHVAILKGSIIYGLNAAGKSNLFKAMDIAKMLINGSSSIDIKNFSSYQNKFLKDQGYNRTKFEFFFLLDKKIFNYGFVIQPLKEKNTFIEKVQVVEEWLIERSSLTAKYKTEKIIFIRENDHFSDTSGIEKIILKENKNKNFITFIKQACTPYQLFLTKLEENGINYISQIKEWFKNLKMFSYITDIYKPDDTILFYQNEQLVNYIQAIIPEMDKDISDIIVEDKLITKPSEINDPSHPILLDEGLCNHMFNNVAGFDNKSGCCVPQIDGILFFLEKRQDGIYKRTLIIKRHGKDFILQEESDGIKRLFQLLPVLFTMANSSKVILIDEIECSFHPILASIFIKQFYKITSQNNIASQLIMTTHNTFFISKKAQQFRKDEIRFMEKDSNLFSTIKSVADFKTRDDLSYDGAYLDGRFIKIPLLNNYNLNNE